MTWTHQHSRRAHSLHGYVLFAAIACCSLPRVASAQDSAESSDTSASNADSASKDDDSVILKDTPASTEQLDKSLADSERDKPPPNKTQKTVGYIVGGAGVVGVVIGTVFGFKVKSQNDTSNGICPTGQLCSAQDQARYRSSVDDAKTDRTVSLLSLGLGGAALITGGVLVFSAPQAKPATVSFVPTVDTNGRVGAVLQGVF